MNRETRNETAQAKPDPVALLSDTEAAQLATAQRAGKLIGLYLPLLATGIGTIVTAVWIPRMPDPMAIHWGPGLQPDGFGPTWSNMAFALGTGLLFVLMYGLQVLQIRQARHRGREQWSATFRFIPAMMLGTTVLMQILAVGTAAIQLDATDARETGSAGWVLLIAGVSWVSITVIAYVIQPRLTIAHPNTRETQPLALTPSERAVWVSQSTVRTPVVILLAVIWAITVAATVWGFTVDALAGWLLLGSSTLLTVAIMTTLWYRVRVDATGLTATSMLGLPVIRVRADEVERVEATHVAPYAEFGGWGIRMAPGRFGIVLRTGDGIVVGRKSKRDFVVTVDDAVTGASLLMTVAGLAGTQDVNREERD